MRINCVILQRRAPRRSCWELRRETGAELLGVLLIKSCVAINRSPLKCTTILRKSVRARGSKTYRGMVPRQNWDFVGDNRYGSTTPSDPDRVGQLGPWVLLFGTSIPSSAFRPSD